MALDLETFKTSLGNIVRPNRFEVVIQPPSDISVADYGGDTVLSMHVQSATIPDRTFNEISIKYYGMEYKIPAGEVLQDLVVSFINDASWNIRSMFEYWAQMINDRSNGTKGYADDLFEDCYIIVRQLDFDGNVIAGYRFKNVFPKTIDQIELSMESNDTYEIFNVTFAYSYWEPEDMTDVGEEE